MEFELYNGEVKVKFQPNPYHRYYVTDPEHQLKGQYTRGVTTYLGIKDKSNALLIWATETGAQFLLDEIAEGREVTEDLVIQAMTLYKQRKEKAADIGTQIHDWCEYFIKHKLGREGYEKKPELPDQEDEKAIYLGATAFLEWVTSHKVEFVASEKVVYDRNEKFIGTADIIARVDGKLALIDLKSSNGLYNEVRMQTAAYAVAYMAEFPDEVIEDRWAIRLAKEDEEEYYEREERKCFMRGKDVNKIKDYAPVEWIKFEGAEALACDYEAFQNCKALFTWNDATDFYKNRKTIEICRPSTKQSSLGI